MTKPVKTYFAYIIANYSRTVLYVGVTNDLERRMYEHKRKTAQKVETRVEE